MLADPNAKLGSITSSSVGDFHPDAQDLNGFHFHLFMQKHCLFAPSTFAHIHDTSPHITYHKDKGTRIDFIALPLSWASTPLVAGSYSDVDSIRDLDDHTPVYIKASPIPCGTHQWVNRKAPVCDVSALNDPEKGEAFWTAFTQHPGVFRKKHLCRAS